MDNGWLVVWISSFIVGLIWCTKFKKEKQILKKIILFDKSQDKERVQTCLGKVFGTYLD